MRIALLAPVWEPVPPEAYGGIELVVSLLAEGLLEEGHEPVLFATGDSKSNAPIEWIIPESLRKKGHTTFDILPEQVAHVAHLYRNAHRFDVIHNHEGLLALGFARLCKTPTLTTLHGPLAPREARLFGAFAELPYASISNAQRNGCCLNFQGTVYNGIDMGLFSPGRSQGYLLFLGRISPEKGTHLAIEVAHKTGYPLVIAGKVDPYDSAYYERMVRPHLDGSKIRFIGEVGGKAKTEVFQGAMALLHPIEWPEPFGLVLVEAMANGIPVVAMGHGSIPEIITSGETGYVVHSVAQMVDAIRWLDRIVPRTCLQTCRKRFHYRRMVQDYLAVYANLIKRPDPTPQ